MLRDPAFRAALGISDEYYQEIRVRVHNARDAVGSLPPPPELIEAGQEREAAYLVVFGKRQHELPASMIFDHRNFNEEQLKAFNRIKELDVKINSIQREIYFETEPQRIAAETATFAEALSPELKQKMLEAQLAAMGETSMISPLRCQRKSRNNVWNITSEMSSRIVKQIILELLMAGIL